MGTKVTILRVLRNGWHNFWRHIWLSAAAISVMTVTLLVISTLVILSFLTNLSLVSIKDKVDVSVYFKPGTQETFIQSFSKDVEKVSGVSSVRYISADEAYIEFQRRHANDPLILEALKELTENPLYPTLVVKAAELEQYPAIASEIEKKQVPEIQKVNFEDNRRAIETLGKLTNGIAKAGLILALFFALVSVMVMYNTIRLTIYNRREEVEIMRLVGATNSYIRWPFIMEGILYALTAVIITTAILLPILSSFIPKINGFLGIDLKLASINSVLLWQIVGLELALGIVLGILSSVFAIRKYLRE